MFCLIKLIQKLTTVTAITGKMIETLLLKKCSPLSRMLVGPKQESECTYITKGEVAHLFGVNLHLFFTMFNQMI